MSRLKKTALFLGDVAVLYASLAATLFIRYRGEDLSGYFNTHLLPFSLIFVVWLAVLYVGDLYKHSAFRSRGALFSSLFSSVFIAGVASVIIFYIFGGFFELTPKTNLAIFSIVFLALDYLMRSAFLGIFRSGATNIVVLGDSPLIKEAVAGLEDNPQAGYKVIRWFGNFDEGSLPSLGEIIRSGRAELVVIQPKLVADPKVIGALYDLLPLGVNLMNFSDFYETIFEKVPLEEVEEGWFVEHIAPRHPIYDRFKRLTDIIFASIGGLILLPLFVLIAVAIKLTSRGPLIYKQERIGRGGRKFTLYKFRSMTDGHAGPLWTEKNDSRITKLGRVLRFTHLDEIPQLFNVLRGDISIVGPRPEAVGLAEKYSEFPYYEIRHILPPGLTGWAQTHFRPSASMAEAWEKLRFDIYYVKNRSFVLDFLIILKTLKYFFANHD
ncbi:MAG: Sugar transferase [Parcubacteria group bacterium LiPW_15]|nr:MAG: Sugar transferase [Parcubacteria group bacterium LiPW_15]